MEGKGTVRVWERGTDTGSAWVLLMAEDTRSWPWLGTPEAQVPRGLGRGASSGEATAEGGGPQRLPEERDE